MLYYQVAVCVTLLDINTGCNVLIATKKKQLLFYNKH